MYDAVVLGKGQNYYNHRHCNNFSVKWPYQMEPFIKKGKLDKDTVQWKSRYGMYDEGLSATIYTEHGKQNWVISDLLMFNKAFNLKKDDVAYYLGLCRYQEYPHFTVQIDGWFYEYESWPCNNASPRYTITYCTDTMKKIKLASYDIDKLQVAKYLLQLMNEIPADELNFNNYYQIGEWYHKNDLPIQRTNWERIKVNKYTKI